MPERDIGRRTFICAASGEHDPVHSNLRVNKNFSQNHDGATLAREVSGFAAADNKALVGPRTSLDPVSRPAVCQSRLSFIQ
jgi:hypothetical protein